MSKEIKMVVWIILCVVAISLLGTYTYKTYLAKTQDIVHPEVTFDIQNYGTVKMELYPEYAPNTVANFIKLIQTGYYNNKVIYGKDEICLYVGRNSEGEAEDPTISLLDNSIEAGTDEDYKYSIVGEFVANGYDQNTLRHEKGVISLIRNDYTQLSHELSDESYNSGNAQIGIMLSDDARVLNGVYAGFGRIIEGLDILEKIYNEQPIASAQSTDSATAEVADETVEDVAEEEETGIEAFAEYPVITSATVETFGNDYGMPQVQEAFDYNSYMYDLFSQQQ